MNNKSKIGILNYNTGNLHSVQNAFYKQSIEATIFSKPEDMQKFDKLFLPGVGAFGEAIKYLRDNHFEEPIKEFAKSGKFILGVCLGSQLLFDKGYEFGEHKGLGLIEGDVINFDKENTQKLKIPHMGWNTIKTQENKIFNKIQQEFYCYFVHSYHIKCNKKYIIGTTNYGYDFASVVNKDNIYGFQPHPEKSHKLGLQVLENFANLS